MLDNQTALAEMLSLLVFDTSSANENISLFSGLKAALLKDGQPIVATPQDNFVFKNPIIDTESLRAAQNDILNAITEKWAVEAITPLFAAINTYSTNGKKVGFYYQHYLNGGQLELSGDLSGFLKGVTTDSASELLDVIDEWQHSSAFVYGFPDLLIGLDRIYRAGSN